MKTSWLATLFAILLAAAGPVAAAERSVVVASKLDTEGALLGTMIALVLDHDGVPVTRKLQLGPTRIVRDALLAGEIDLYPEYTGNGAFFFQKQDDPAWKDAAAGYELVKRLDRANGIVWLAPAPADNTWGIAVRRDVASQNGLASMEDFARWVTSGGPVKLAASAEFVDSPAALPSFEAAYGFRMKPDQIITLSSGDTAVMIRAAAQRISCVNAAMVYTTDGAIAAVGLVLLSDPRHAQVVYAPAPTVRADVLQRFPQIETSLAPLFRSLNLETLQGLNAAVAVEGRNPEDVARDYLVRKGFLK